MIEIFTQTEREALREALIARAQQDPDVSAAALVGSVATGREDRWSDIDLVLGVEASVVDTVAHRWTNAMYGEHGAVHHLDVVAAGVLYRVFLLASSLQVDISFWPQDQVRATEESFQLLFGEVNEPTVPREQDPAAAIGWAWLYALHARSALARGRTWQAVMMLDDLRNQVLSLACLRHGLVAFHGRGVDQLPTAVLAAFADAHSSDLTDAALARRFRSLLDLLLTEIIEYDRDLAERLRPSLLLLTSQS
ncbi:nucleotidyltransferase domain-containing protein [Pseudactinotalea terrae]|uniref:nucleotidyltransferase domain-containing protein n=1 Tax=Pseudactinotalea terrae TaxID=1743262 RepID=UPI0012E15956|nr:nucleotidyltransferase domain-containing protein [Pseudactinotalea terrae]